MKRLGLILAASWLMTASVAKAGELDAEYSGKAKVVQAAPVLDKPLSELDAESPTQACCIKRWLCGYGGYGYGGYYGYGAYGYGRRCCLLGYGGGFGYGGYGGYGGFGGYGGGFGGYGGGLGYGGFGGYGGGFY
jgi:hypothetical protein